MPHGVSEDREDDFLMNPDKALFNLDHENAFYGYPHFICVVNVAILGSFASEYAYFDKYKSENLLRGKFLGIIH